MYNPQKTRYCALGCEFDRCRARAQPARVSEPKLTTIDHHETGRTDPLYQAVIKGKEHSISRTAQRTAEIESAVAWFDENFGKVVNFRGDGPDPICPPQSTPISQHHSRLDLAWGPYSTGQDRYWQGEWRGPWSLSPIHFRPTASSRSTGVPVRMDGGRSA